MHADLLTVEATVKETFRVRSARLKEFGSAGIIPHALREGVRYYFIPRNAFSQTGSHPILSTLLLGVSRALQRHHRIKPPASIMALSLTKLVGSQHAPICVVPSSVSTRRIPADMYTRVHKKHAAKAWMQ
jgi:hypothetical protein